MSKFHYLMYSKEEIKFNENVFNLKCSKRILNKTKKQSCYSTIRVQIEEKEKKIKYKNKNYVVCSGFTGFNQFLFIHFQVLANSHKIQIIGCNKVKYILQIKYKYVNQKKKKSAINEFSNE